MTIILGSVFAGILVGALSTILATKITRPNQDPPAAAGETPIFDALKPSLAALQAQGESFRDASGAEWYAIKAGDR